ncbi:MAG: chromate reductase [Saprospiraceae bacterium]|jgi:chromate reductase
MKILAFAASNSRQSINKQLVTYASSVIGDAQVELLDLNNFEMPIYSADREAQSGVPSLAQQFFDKIGAADGLLISYAEHNGS